MKKILCLLLSVMMVLSMTAAFGEAQPETSLFTPGTYEASEQGLFVPVKVQITVSENEITNVLIDSTGETPELGGAAASKLAEAILSSQTPHVDALSGATVTSNAIIKAAEAALKEAGADLEALDANRKDAQGGEAQPRESKTVDTDIVIIGAGGAGMTAAIVAKQAGRDFVLLEKMPYVGGNTTKATGGMNAAETHYQKEQGIEDSVELFVKDTMEGGHNLNDPALVEMMARSSADAIDWLDSIGASLPKISFSGGASVNRIHAPEDGSGVGSYLVDHFSAKLNELGVEVMLETAATELLTDGEGRIIGVKAESADTEYTFNCSAVILASGGFGANEEMYTQYRPDLKGTVTTNAPGATGDGIVMAEKLGAATVDMEQIQLHPTVEQSTSMLITESVRGDGAILVNQKGERFVNELLTRDAVSAAELEQDGQYAYILFDQNLRDHLKAIEKYVKANLTVQADTIEGLAEQLNIDPATLAKTLSDWNEAVKNQEDPQFGRTTGMNADLTTPPYYVVKIAPGIHHTMGGIKINTATEVIKKDGSVIPGLFAAGEVTGGVHGGNRLGGNAVADIVIFGRIAADSAMKYIDAGAEGTDATAPAAGGYTPGTYEASDWGYGQKVPVTVKITVDENSITAAEISGEEEEPFGKAYFGIYAESLIGRTDGAIDAMTNATLTRDAVEHAVGKALKVARGEMKAEDALVAAAAAEETTTAAENAASATEEAAPATEEAAPVTEEAAPAASTGSMTFTPGEYTAIETGFNGAMAVKVTFSETKIESIEVVSSGETPEIGGAAMEKLIPLIIEANSTGVDGVSGATFSSNALRNAVSAAAEHAGCSNLEAFKVIIP